jgi:hypothetical protein
MGKKSPADAGLVCSKGTLTTATLFIAAVLLTLTGRLVLLSGRLLLPVRTFLTAGRGLVGALVLLSGRLLLLVRALTAGRGLVGALVLLSGRLLLVCATLARGDSGLARRGITLGADLVRQSER